MKKNSWRVGITGIAGAVLAPMLIVAAAAATAPAQPAQPQRPAAQQPAQPAQPQQPAQGGQAQGQQIDAKAEMKGVLTQPFDDFNLTRTEIPPGLIPIEANPYGMRPNMTCNDIRTEIAYIDGLIGEDVGPALPDEDNSIMSEENRTTAARNLARSAASSWIPFRGLVREVTGAESHARAFKEAVLAGFVRRAYFKGIAETRRCPAISAAAAAAARAAAVQASATQPAPAATPAAAPAGNAPARGGRAQ
jgi:hypothetical protein